MKKEDEEKKNATLQTYFSFKQRFFIRYCYVFIHSFNVYFVIKLISMMWGLPMLKIESTSLSTFSVVVFVSFSFSVAISAVHIHIICLNVCCLMRWNCKKKKKHTLWEVVSADIVVRWALLVRFDTMISIGWNILKKWNEIFRVFYRAYQFEYYWWKNKSTILIHTDCCWCEEMNANEQTNKFNMCARKKAKK